jgi:hypothetical protein
MITAGARAKNEMEVMVLISLAALVQNIEKTSPLMIGCVEAGNLVTELDALLPFHGKVM